jgi:hypothetical protein
LEFRRQRYGKKKGVTKDNTPLSYGQLMDNSQNSPESQPLTFVPFAFLFVPFGAL